MTRKTELVSSSSVSSPVTELTIPGLEARVKELTNGRGVDTVIEGVGHADALKTGFDLLRPWGNISSFGVHNEEIPWSGNQAYGKNLRIQMGRCPVRSKGDHLRFGIY